MIRIIIILFLLTNVLFGQTDDRFQRSFQLENEFKTENLIDNYNLFDFSKIWTKTKNNNVLGIIGKEHQRIQIKLISVKKNSNNLKEYLVFGKSRVGGVICDFTGEITLTEIKEVKEFHFGVDEEYVNKGIKAQGVIIATYKFKENKEQIHSGIFRGKVYSKWYLNSKNQVKYDNIEFFTNGYMNNAFVGVWENNKTENKKICNWADYRIPNTNQDFDIGAGGFSVSKKYYGKGWLNRILENKSPNLAITTDSVEENIKEWWE